MVDWASRCIAPDGANRARWDEVRKPGPKTHKKPSLLAQPIRTAIRRSLDEKQLDRRPVRLFGAHLRRVDSRDSRERYHLPLHQLSPDVVFKI